MPQPPRPPAAGGRPLWAGALLRGKAPTRDEPGPTREPAPSPLELLRATAPPASPRDEAQGGRGADGDWRRGGLVTRTRLRAGTNAPRSWDEVGAVVSATQILRAATPPTLRAATPTAPGPDDTLTDTPAPTPPPGTEPPTAPPLARRVDAPNSPAPRTSRPSTRSPTPTPLSPAPLPFDPDGRRLGSEWLVHYARRKATGRLTLARRGTTARVQLDHGRAVRVRLVPERPEESLGRLLLAQGLLTPAAAERARSYAEHTSCLFGVAVLRTTEVPPGAIVKALLGRLRGRLEALAVEPPERVSFEPLAPPDKGAIPSGVAVEPLLFDALVRRYAARAPRAVAAAEAELADRFVVKRPGLPSPAEAAALDAGERALWESLGGEPARLREINGRSAMSPRRTHAALFALRDLGYLAFDTAAPRATGAQRYAALLRRDPAAPGAGGTPFDVLGAHWSLDGPGLESLHGSRREALRRARPQGPLDRDTLALEAAVLGNLEAAAETLRSADARRAARRAVASAQQVAQAAEHYVRQGDMAVFRGDATGALEHYRRALDLVPRQADATRKLARLLPSVR